MNRAIKIVSEIPSNKAGITLFANALVEGLMTGEVDPLEVRAKVDAIEKIIKAVKADQRFVDVVLDRADMEPEKTFEFNGITFTKAESAKYDYSGDEIWASLKEQEAELAELRKSEETTLRTLKAPTEINGVLRHPPVKKSTTYVRVTF